MLRVAGLTYQLSPQPSPLASQKLYACQVFVERTTATRESGTARLTTNGAYPTRPSGALSRRK
jgi:hypothetical protein